MSNITEATKEDWEDFWNELESSEEECFERQFVDKQGNGFIPGETN